MRRFTNAIVWIVVVIAVTVILQSTRPRGCELAAGDVEHPADCTLCQQAANSPGLLDILIRR